MQKWMVDVFERPLAMTGEALRNLNDTSDSICCLLGLHVSLPRCLRLWHRPLPLRLFLGGVQPGGLCLPGSKELHPPHDSLAVAIKRENKIKTYYLRYIATVFFRVKLWLSRSWRQIFCPLEKHTVESSCPKSCDIHPSAAFGPA